MTTRGIVVNLVLVAAFVLIVWAILDAMGMEMALGISLIASVVATLLINLVLVAFRRGRTP